MHRNHRARWPAAIILLAGLAATSPSRAARRDASRTWDFPIPGQGAVLADLPATWTEVERDRKSGVVRFKPSDGVKAEMRWTLTWSEMPDPALNGPSRIRTLVEDGAREFLDQAVESRYTIRELRGPQAGGYYWTLRDRMPKKRPWAAYVTRGAIGTGSVLLEFTLLTPQSDLPEIRQALKMLAGIRQAEPGAEPPAGP